jgi:hypothetical protein
MTKYIYRENTFIERKYTVIHSTWSHNMYVLSICDGWTKLSHICPTTDPQLSHNFPTNDQQS